MARLIRVHWLDAYAENHWNWDAPEIEPQRCITVGYLVAESETYLLLAATLGLGGGQTNARFAIPKGCILDREDLGECAEVEVGAQEPALPAA